MSSGSSATTVTRAQPAALTQAQLGHAHISKPTSTPLNSASSDWGVHSVLGNRALDMNQGQSKIPLVSQQAGPTSQQGRRTSPAPPQLNRCRPGK